MDARDRLIEATRELLWDRGYVGTSPRDILARAGVGQGSMYHHFRGKADLAAAALRRNADEMRASGETVFADGTGVLDRLVAYLTRRRPALRGCRIGRMSEDPDVLADPRLRAPVEETLGWYRERVADLLAEGQASGELTTGFAPRQVAATVVAVVQGGYVLAKAAQSAEPFDDAIAGAVALLTALRTEEEHA
ncbi:MULTISPECIES: TetR/AcrR family transcriptional regulator [Catenuloplanes]|uniref:AcrR family transcriptional regulator n=1 Tax=Catenuloplanes niger TaxID=587534 RepID=A0AAE4CYP3_9ACTN|nr:helix-turn-helix domain-containing protein [Catenuloplanes niger]MDR7327808.1 AcrR family transcriptional regulator [Catenuloplanes niger]